MKKEKTIVTPQLFIAGNIMTWKSSALQLSNISSISTVPLELMPFPLWAILMFVLGLGAFAISMFVAVSIIAAAVFVIHFWYKENEKLKTQRHLLILMNSGITFSFLFTNQRFLEQVYGVLGTIIAEGGETNQHVEININNSTISGNTKILNDMFIC